MNEYAFLVWMPMRNELPRPVTQPRSVLRHVLECASHAPWPALCKVLGESHAFVMLPPGVVSMLADAGEVSVSQGYGQVCR